MADNLEQLVLEILTRDRASDSLSKIGARAEDASVQTDKLNKRLDELGRKSATARVKLDGDKDASASLDRINAKLLSIDRRTSNPNIKIEGIAKASAEISALELELDHLGEKTAETKTEMAALSGPSGIGLLIGAGVALAPVLATLSVGFGGLALAAYSTISPVLKAGTATAAARKELEKLTPAQRDVYDSLGTLKTEFGSFTRSLQPEVLTVFNAAVKDAGGLLHDIQPVAAATGKAFGGFLGEFGQTLNSGEFKGFFNFMAQSAGPDMQLLGGTLIDLTKDIPPLVQAFQPLAQAALTGTDDLLKLVGAAEKAHLALPLAGAAIGARIGAMLGPGGGLPGAVVGTGIGTIIATATSAGHALDRLTGSSDHLVASLVAQARAAAKVQQGSGGLFNAIQADALAAGAFARAVDAVNAAETKALTPLLNYTNALIAQKNDEATLRQALKKSGDEIGLKTQKQRDSFGAAQQYIQQILDSEAAAQKANKGISTQISLLQNALPALERAKGGTAGFRQEVSGLVAELHRLQTMRQIDIGINIIAKSVGTVPAQVSAGFSHLFSSGGRVPGYGGGDRHLALLEGGEAVVPKHLTGAVAPFLKAHGVPGFAAGGIVGGGGSAGIQVTVDITASLSAAGRAVARDFTAMLSHGLLGSLTGSPGQIAGAAGSLEALVRRAVKAGVLSGGEGTSVNDLIGTDSARLRSLSAREQAIASKIAAARQYASSVTSGVLSQDTITAAAQGTTGPEGIINNLRADVVNLRAFAAGIAKLRKMGLDDAFLQQIIQAGPAQGLPIVNELLQGGEYGIRQINRSESQLHKIATTLGKDAADALYDGGKTMGKGFLSKLKAEQRQLEEQARKMADALVRQLEHDLGADFTPRHGGRPLGGGGSGPGVKNELTVNVHAPVGSNGKDIGRQIAEYLTQFIKAGGRLYPPGVTPR